MTTTIYKSFGTFMDEKYKYKYASFKASKDDKKKKFTKVLPEQFNPLDQWGNLLDAIQNQGECNCCWATASASALTDRYILMTLGQVVDELSPYQMIMCQGAIIVDKDKSTTENIKDVNIKAHSQGACNGNTIYNAMDFLYCFGLTSERCVNEGEFSQYGIKKLTDISTVSDVPLCQQAVGKNYDTCLDKETAARFYRICAGYLVDPDVESIKQEIYKWGPVVSSFQIFDNFLNEYDGLTIYKGPIKEEELPLGGHAIKILGWGKEKDPETGNMIDYWWIANSWGSAWGLSGYFKMAMNISRCQLEQNVVGFIPDLYGFNKSYLLYDVHLNTANDYLRDEFAVDQKTGYRKNAIELIKNGKLKGNLDDFICKYTPDFKTMWLGEMNTQDIHSNYLRVAQWHSTPNYMRLILKWMIILIISIGCYYIGKKLKRSKLITSYSFL